MLEAINYLKAGAENSYGSLTNFAKISGKHHQMEMLTVAGRSDGN
jgi:hypothetical protein